MLIYIVKVWGNQLKGIKWLNQKSSFEIGVTRSKTHLKLYNFTFEKKNQLRQSPLIFLL